MPVTYTHFKTKRFWLKNYGVTGTLKYLI